MQKKLLLFGGTGFLGSHVALRALLRGYKVVSATRQGEPIPGSPLAQLATRAAVLGGPRAAAESLGLPLSSSTSGSSAAQPDEESLADAVMRAEEGARALEFVSLDATSRSQVFNFLHDHPDATAVVSCIGLLTRDYDAARKINGDTNTNISAGVFHEKLVPRVSKLVYVSAEPYHLYSPHIIGSKRLLKGYFHGKRIAEKAVLENHGTRGVVLRPGMIYGTRYVPLPSATDAAGTCMAIPLGWVGYPLHCVLYTLGGRKLLVPPVDVNVVAETAIRACEWAGVPSLDVSGVLDVYKMLEICAAYDPAEPQHSAPRDGQAAPAAEAAEERRTE